jgi:hypothetical protein
MFAQIERGRARERAGLERGIGKDFRSRQNLGLLAVERITYDKWFLIELRKCVNVIAPRKRKNYKCPIEILSSSERLQAECRL